jgi:hypothetical protein
MQPQRVKYLAPKIKISIGGLYELVDTVREYHVWSSLIEPADICEFVVADFFDELKTGLAENMELSIAWGYKGYDFTEIFKGLVSHFKEMEPKLIKIRGLDFMKYLFDAEITKTFQEERPTSIIINLVDELGLGLDTSGVEEITTLLDKLPLYQDNIVHAIQTINRRLQLEYYFWFNIEGILHWRPLEIPDEATFHFVYGENIIDIEVKSNQRLEVTTIGQTIRHGERVSVKQRDGSESDYFVEKTHYYQDNGKGSRTALLLRQIG